MSLLNQSGAKYQKGDSSYYGPIKKESTALSRLPIIKGAVSPIDGREIKMGDPSSILNGLGASRERSIAAAVAGTHSSVGPVLGRERSLERNPSVLSRKELIKQEYNLLLETRLPNIMQIMNSEKSLGLGLGIMD